MRRALHITLKVIYYIFAFGIGLILAYTLPTTLFYNNSVSAVQQYIEDENYKRVLEITCNYSDVDKVYESSSADGVKLVMFTAVNVEQDEDHNPHLYKSYVGYLIGAKSTYDVKMGEGNQAKIVFKASDSTTYNYTIIDYDSDNDGIKDSVSSYMKYSFLFFEVTSKNISNISSIELLDKTGSIFHEYKNMSFSFDEKFFTDFNDLMTTYNNDSKASLTELETKALNSDSSYTKRDYGTLYKDATVLSTIYVLLYFILIYILADFLVGKRFILRGIKALIRKIRGVTKEEEDSKAAEQFGTDYYSMVTFVVTCDSEITSNMRITYSNDDAKLNAEFIITRDNEFKQTQRLHAGTYLNPWFECDGYQVIDLPDVLNVRGYKMTVEVKVAKIQKDEGKE